MPWFRIDDDATFNQKVMAAGNEGFGAFVRMGAWSMHNLTDGFVREDVADAIAPRKVIDRLISAGMLHRLDGGYQIHDHLDRNPSAEQIRKVAADKAAAGRAGGKQSGRVRGSKPEAKHEAAASASAGDLIEQNRTTGEANTKQTAKPFPFPSASPREADPDPPPPVRPRVIGFNEQQQWSAAWEAADLPGHPMTAHLVAAWNGTPERQRTTVEETCLAYKALIDQQRRDGLTPNPSVEHMVRSWGTVIDMARGAIAPLAARRPRPGDRKFNDGIGAQPVTKEEEL